MATYRAIASGNWSTLAQWEYYNGASWVAAAVLPTVADDVYPNGFVVQVDQTISVKSLRCSAITGVLTGGRFEIGTNVNVTTVDGIFGNGANAAGANILQSCLLITAVCTTIITSNCTSTGAWQNAIGNNAASNLTIIGNQTVSGGGSRGVWNTASAIIIIIGNQVCAGSATSSNAFLNTGTNADINITGNQTGGGGGIDYGINNTAVCTSLIITGNQTGGAAAAINNTAGGFTIIGNQIASAGVAISNSANGATITITGNAAASSTTNAIYNNTTSTIIYTGNLTNNLSVMAIFSIRLYYNVTSTSVWQFSDLGGNSKYLYGAGVNIGNPIPADVRDGVTYDPNGTTTGTLAVPPPASVALNVPTDDTVGTLVTATTPADFIAALKLDDLGIRLGKCATTANVNNGLAAYDV